MFKIQSEELVVTLLDPNDLAHTAHGVRYCRGGYIWDVTDKKSVSLISGPEYPNPNPSAFNGQGLPEVFRHELKKDESFLTREEDGRGFILGVGQVSGPHGVDAAKVESDAVWEVEHQDNRITMTTTHEYNGLSCSLLRTIEVAGTEVISKTTLVNIGGKVLPLEWYAHPFLPHTEGLTQSYFADGIAVEKSEGFEVKNNWLAMNPEAEWNNEGHFAWLEWRRDDYFKAVLNHPVTETLELELDHPVSMMPVWANKNTFSLEPYIYRNIIPGEKVEFAMTYRFGAGVVPV